MYGRLNRSLPWAAISAVLAVLFVALFAYTLANQPRTAYNPPAATSAPMATPMAIYWDPNDRRFEDANGNPIDPASLGATLQDNTVSTDNKANDKSTRNLESSSSNDSKSTEAPVPSFEHTGGFAPDFCLGERGLPDGYAGPLTSEVIPLFNATVGSKKSLGTSRVGTECATWTSRFDANHATVTCPDDFLCHFGAHGREELYLGNGQRVNDVHGYTIRYIGPVEGSEMGTFPEGDEVYDPCLFLDKANHWGSSLTDRPNFPVHIVRDSGFTCEGVDTDSTGTGTRGSDEQTGGGGSLADLNCDSAKAVASVFPGTSVSNWHPEGNFAHGWVYDGPAYKATVPDGWSHFDTNASGKNVVGPGSRMKKAQTGFTAWCLP